MYLVLEHTQGKAHFSYHQACKYPYTYMYTKREGDLNSVVFFDQVLVNYYAPEHAPVVQDTGLW